MIACGFLKAVLPVFRLRLLPVLCGLGLVCLQPVSAMATGGDLTWSYGLAKTGKQEVTGATFDSDGHAILIGLDGATNSDWLVAKMRTDGSGAVWTAGFDYGSNAVGIDAAMAVAVDSANNVIVAGFVHNGNDYDIQVIKYAADGDGSGNPVVLWQHTYDGGHGGDDRATSVGIDSQDNVYVGGYGQDLSGKEDFILLKYTRDDAHPDLPGPNINQPQWTQPWNGASSGHDMLQALAVGPDGIAVTGKSQNATPDFDVVTIKYGFDKQMIGSPKIRVDAGDGEGRDVVIDQYGNVVTTGFVFNGTNRDLYLARFPADMASTIWTEIINKGNDDEGYSLALDDSGDVYVTGTTYSVTTQVDVYTARFRAADRAEVWSHVYNSNNGDNDIGRAIWVDDNGEVYVAGYDDNAVTGFDDMLVLKYRKDASTGTLLWERLFDGASHNDRAVAIGPGLRIENQLTQVLVAGWSDLWTAGATDYDFALLNYDPGATNPPTGLTAVTVSDNAIDLVWSDNATGTTNEDGYVVERKVCNTGSYVIVTVPPLVLDSTSYSDTGLSPDTHYCYRVKATSASQGDSPYSNEASAQTTVINPDTPTWMYSYGAVDAGDDVPAAIAVGPDNQPVVTGYAFGGDTGFDYHTIKLNRADATKIWSATYDDPSYESDFATSVAVDGTNQVIVTGYASLWGGGAGYTNDIYSLWYPSGGGVSTHDDQYNGPSGMDDRSSSVAVSVDANNNSAVIGYGKNAQNNDDIYLLKFAADGTRQWAITPYDNGGNDYPEALAFDLSGDIFVVGSTQVAGKEDWFVAKYKGLDGSLAWPSVQLFAAPAGGSDQALSVAVDASGDAYVTGFITDAGGKRDWYTIKYNGADGTRTWEKSYDGPGAGDDQAEAVVIDRLDGSVLVAGTVTVAAGNRDFALLRYTPAGDLIWDRRYNAVGSNDQLYTAAIDLNGAVTLVGVATTGINEDMLSVKYDWQGTVIGVSHYDASGADDGAVDVAVNRYGEAFVAGYTTNLSGNMDYAVFKAEGDVLQSVYPLSGVAYLNHADLVWADNNLIENAIEIERRIGACGTGNQWANVATLLANSTGYTDNTLNTGTTYCYRVRAVNENGQASRWLERELSTAAPVVPGGFKATATSSTTILLEWTDTTVGESHFEVQRCEGGTCDFEVDPVETISVNANLQSHIDSNLCPERTYRYRIRAVRTDTWWTDWVLEADAPGTTSALPPTLVSVTRISETQLRLDWTGNTTDHTGYEIRRCLEGVCTTSTVGSTTVLRNENSLKAGATYTYDVRALKTGADCQWPTAWSNAIERETTILPPDGLLLTANDTTTVKLDWNDNTVSESGFRVAACSGTLADCCPSGVCTVGSFSETGTTGASVKTLVDASRCQNSATTYRVQAFGSDWESSWSAAVQIQTPTAVVPVLTANPQTESTIDLTWNETLTDASSLTLQRCTGDLASCASGPYVDLPSLGVQLRYKMNQATWGDGVLDSSGFNRTGSVVGATLVAGYRDNAAAFTGQNDYINSPLNIDQGSTTPGATFAAWVFPTSSGTYRNVISTDNGGNDWSLYQQGGFWAVTDGANYHVTTASAVLNTWQHIAATFDRLSGIRLYKNGVQVYSSASISFDTSDANVTIGRRGTYTTSSYYFDGRIDDVQVFTRPLNATEITQLMADGFLDIGLLPDTTYTYKLTASKTATCPWGPLESAPVAAKTKAILPPTGFSATPTSTTSVALAWNDDYGSETRFVLQRCNGDFATCCPNSVCDDSAADAKFINWSATAAAGSKTTTDSSVCYGNNYMYRLRAEKTSAVTWLSGWASGAAATATPAAPVLTLTSFNETQAVLDWTDPNSDETGMRVLRCTGDGCTPTSVIASLGAGVKTYTDTTVSSWNLYRYRVVADRTASCDWHMESNIVEADLNLPKPEPFVVEYLTPGLVNLKWTDLYTNESGYRLQRCAGTLAECVLDTSFTDVAVLAAGTTRHAESTLCAIEPNFTYRVRAESAAWSQPTSWAKLEVAPTLLAPSTFTATSTFESEIDVTWEDSNLGGDRFVLRRCKGNEIACADGAAVWDNVPTQPRDPANTALALRMDEFAWNNLVGQVIDSSGNARHGTPYGDVTTTAAGAKERAGLFDGTNDYILTSLVLDQTDTGPGATLSASVFPTRTDLTYQHVVSTLNGGFDWGFGAYNGQWFVYNGTTTLFTAVPAVLNDWQHISVTFTPGSGVVLYKNGVQVYSSATIGHSVDTGAVTIGRSGTTAGNYFSGRIDEVSVHASALSAQAVLDMNARTSVTDQGLLPATTYTYRIYEEELAAGGRCGWSSPIAEATETTQTPPSASGLTAVALDTTSINLGWMDESSSETGFRLQRCDDVPAVCCPDAVCDDNDDANFVNLNVLLPAGAGTGSVTHVDSSPCEDGNYTYRLRPENSDWDVMPAWVSVNASTPAISAPVNLTATPLSESEIRLKWDGRSIDENGNVVERCLGDASACNDSAGVFEPVTTLPPNGSGQAVLHYRMDESAWSGVAGEVVDESGAGRHGSAVNGPLTTDAAKYGRAGSFDGTNDYLTTPLNLDQADTSTGITFAAWVYPTIGSDPDGTGALVDERYVFGTDATTANSYFGLYMLTQDVVSGYASTTNRHWYVSTGSQRLATSANYTLNQWQHVALVFTPNVGLDFYLNGVKVKTFTAAQMGYTTADVNLILGRRGNAAAGYFGGRMDEVVVFSQALDAAAINQNYLKAFRQFETLDVNLSPATTYTYRVRADKALSEPGCGWSTSHIYATAITDVPLPPSNLTIGYSLSNRVDLTWKDTTSSETAFVLERCAGTVCVDIPVAANTESFYDTGVCEATLYDYRIKAVGAGWESNFSSGVQTTTRAVNDLGPLTVTVLNEGQVELAWDDANPDELRYVVERCDGDNATCTAGGGVYTEVTSLSDQSQGLRAYYRFDETAYSGAEREVFDTSFQRQESQTQGGVVSQAAGKYGRAAQFDGVDDAIITPLMVDQSATSPGATFEAWVYPTRTTGTQAIMSTDNGGYDWGFGMSGTYWYIYTGGDFGGSTIYIPVTVNAWQHVVATFKPGVGVTFYVNGVSVWTTTSLSFEDSSASLRVGRQGTSGNFFQGSLDEAAVFNRPLSAEEVAAHHAEQLFSRYHQIDGDLIGETPYTYRVRAVSDAGCDWSRLTDPVTVTTLSPAAPSELAVDGVDTYEVRLKWTDNTGAESAFAMQRCTDEACDFSSATTFDVTANATAYADGSGCNGDSFRYRIRAERPADPSDPAIWPTAWSNVAETSKPQLVAPTALRVTKIDVTTVAIDWTDSTPDEVGFKVERCQSDDCPVFVEIGTVGAGITHFEDTGLFPETGYRYRVRAYKGGAACANEGGISAEIGYLTDPSADQNLSVAPINSRVARLSWPDIYSGENGYEVEIKIWHGGFVKVGQTEANATGYDDSWNLEPGKFYTYRIRPFTAATSGAYSKEATVEMPAFDQSHTTCKP